MRGMLELLRVRQWVKNGFVLAPLFFGARLGHRELVIHAVDAFAAFCLLSSAIYIFNDWRDIESDRQHVKKSGRPLPSGRVSIPAAFAALILLAASSLCIAYLGELPASFFLVAAAYVVVNLSYSLGLKHVAVLELFLVSSGFVLRLLAGGIAVEVELSPWIVIATGSIALLLTTGKRRGDIARGNDAQFKRKSLASYNLAYLDSVLSALTGGTFVVYLLFTVSAYATARYGEAVIVTAIPVTLGLMRYLQLVMVCGDGDSPTDLLLKDAGLIAIVLVFMAMFGGLIYLK
jgi:decaprenyl-phosphate phosphoribosyltransferase